MSFQKLLPCQDHICMLVQIYLAVFGAAISHLDVWQSCRGAGVHYKVTTAGLVTVFSLSALLQAGMVVYGFQGELPPLPVLGHS